MWDPLTAPSRVTLPSLCVALSLLLLLHHPHPVSGVDLPEAVILGEAQDWLVHRITTPVTLTPESSSPITCRPPPIPPSSSPSPSPSPPLTPPCLRLTNGLLSRVFLFSPTFGTVDLYSHSSRRSLLRTLTPEAVLSLDGHPYPIGGLQLDPSPSTSPTPPEHAYANRSAWRLTTDPTAWTYHSHSTSAPLAPFPWTPGTRHSPTDVQWPPRGLRLSVTWQAPASAPPSHGVLLVQSHYEMYEGLPLLAQWLSVNSSSAALGGAAVRISGVQVVSFAANSDFSPVPFANYPGALPTVDSDVLSRLYVTTDQAHSTAVQWTYDVALSQTPGSAQPELNVSYASGPGVILSPSPYPSPSPASAAAPPPSFASFTSFRAFLLVTDSIDRERHGLSVRRLTRTLAPATLESPIFFHVTDASSAGIRSAVDQMAAVGFDMLILSFGTEFDLESQDPAYIARMKGDIDYARARGIEVGGYDLIVWTRDVGEEWDAVSPDTNRTHGDACFASGWYDRLLQLAVGFINATGLSGVETDGPYPGYACASTNHSHHLGLADSVYHQTRLQADFFHRLRALGVYIHQPDEYFYAGASKTAIGYNEDQFSLPRWTDLSVTRQGVYEDLYLRIPTQGWGFLPLVDYHSGGAAAAFEPLSQHLDAYEWALFQYLSAGVGACYRGPRLFDTDATRVVVARWVSFYTAHRAILNSDVIHARRPDMQGLDYIVHENAQLEERGLVAVFNPTHEAIETTIVLPLYYTGLENAAWVREGESGKAQVLPLDRLYNVRLPVAVGAMNFTWFLIKSPPSAEESAISAVE